MEELKGNEKNFTKIPIVPDEALLMAKEVYFRPMPESGDLISSRNYLDLLFRLLHEDAL